MFFPKNVHVGAAGGIGMSGVAKLLEEKGHVVTISDKASADGDAVLPESAQMLIISSAMKATHPQIIQAKERCIPIVHRMDAVVELLREKKVLGAFGSHGKTTTSSMLANVLYNQTYIIGGMHMNRGSNAQWCETSYAVIETDESDRSFEKISVYGGVMTSLDPEHLEAYSDDFNVQKQAFEDYFNKLPNSKMIMLNLDDKNLQTLNVNCTTYGENPAADYKIKNIRGNVFDIITPTGKHIKDIKLGVIGRHFVQNAAGVVVLCDQLGISEEQIKHGLGTFKGAERRLTLLGEKKGVIFIDDYGHHPVKIRASLHAIREQYPDKPIIVILEPHRYTRISRFWDEYVHLFDDIDYVRDVFLLPLYGSSEDPIEGITSENLVKANPVRYSMFNQLPDNLAGCVVVSMGAGDNSDVIKCLYEKY